MQCYSGVLVFRWYLGLWTFLWLWLLQVHAVLEYMDIDPLKFASAPGPFGDRGGYAPHGTMGLMAGSVVCCVRSISDALPWSRYSDGPLNSRPQPLGSRREAAPCEDTREDFGLSF